MEFEIIPTARLNLRVIRPETYNDIFQTCSEMEIRELLGLDTDALFEKELERFRGGATCHNRSRMLFQLRDAISHDFLGSCDYHIWYVEHRRAEIGYKLNHESRRRQGLMSEAMSAVLDYGFRRMNLHRVEACVGEDNTPSLRLMEKFGFTYEGFMREHYRRGVEVYSSRLFSLLQPEYFAGK